MKKINNKFHNNHLILLFIISLFVLCRGILLFVYSYPINLYCGDSAYYLHLAKHLDQASADRPSGYPMILRLFLPIIYKSWYVIPIIQFIFSFIVLIYSIIILKQYFSRNLLILWTLIVFFNYHAVFMEKSIMSDSIAYNLLIIGSVIILSGNDSCWWNIIIISFISGSFPLLRTNYIVFSLLFMLILIVKSFIEYKFNKRFFMNIILIVMPFLIIYLLYTNLFVYPRLGVKNISSFGGRTLFSRLMVYTKCDVLKNLELDKEFSKILNSNCEDLNNKHYGLILFSENGFITAIDKNLHMNRGKSDLLYRDISKKIIIKNPFVVIRIFFQSVVETINANSSFYRSNVYPMLGGGCETLPQEFGTTKDNFNANNKLNTTNLFITIIAFMAALSQKLVVLFLYIIIPIWLLIEFIKNKAILFVKIYWKSIIILLATISYFSISLIFAGFDYRFIQPLWLAVIWIKVESMGIPSAKHKVGCQ